MLESALEAHFCRKVRTAGGRTKKLKWVNARDAPDRLVLFFGQTFFVELKREGERPRPGQLAQHREFISLAAKVFVVHTKQTADLFVELASEGAYRSCNTPFLIAQQYHRLAPQVAISELLA